MPLTRFAMIIKGPGYDPSLHRASIDSPVFSSTVVFVSSFEQAIPVAKELVQQGIQLIELCSGFTPEQASSLHDLLDKQIPVGVVRYSFEEQKQLDLLFDKKAPVSA